MRPDMTIQEYLQNHDLMEVEESFIYLYGPYICMHPASYEGLISDLKKRFSIMTLFHQGAILIRKLEENQTYGELKRAILGMNRDYQKTGPVAESEQFTTICQACIERVREHQIEHAQLESAMIGYAPIIPYEGMMLCKSSDGAGAPYPVAIKAKEADGYSPFAHTETFIKTYFVHLSTGESPKQMMNDLLGDHLIPILLNTGLTPIISINDIKRIPVEGLEGILSQVNAPIIYENYQYYYFVAMSYFCHLTNQDDFNHFYRAAINSAKNPSFENLISACILPTITNMEGFADEIFSMESWEFMTKKTQQNVERVLREVNENNPVGESAYDLDRMMAFIHTHRHINCNEYANTLFLSETKGTLLTNINTFSDNILLCEVNDSVLVCPFTDLADDYQIKLLCMNKDGEIYVKNDFRFDSENSEEIISEDEEHEIQ